MPFELKGVKCVEKKEDNRKIIFLSSQQESTARIQTFTRLEKSCERMITLRCKYESA